MAAPRNRKHILVRKEPSTEKYRPHPQKIDPIPFPAPSNRQRHAADLRNSLVEAKRQAEETRASVDISVYGAKPGLYISFESPQNIDLKLESLEAVRSGIELLSVKKVQLSQDGPEIQIATVFVPDGKVKHFLNRFQEYSEEKTKKGEPRHKDLIDRIANLRKATLQALWTEDREAFPDGSDPIWWEIWLRKHDGKELERLLEFCEQVGLEVGDRQMGFEDRIVVLVHGTSSQLSTSLDVLNDLAEVRKAKEPCNFFIDSDRQTQVEWVEDLRDRVISPSNNWPVICLLDTGITSGHPLFKDFIFPKDVLAVNPDWRGNDDGGGPGNMGHGTQMAGLALYGDLTHVLLSSLPVKIRHRLESVKILPPPFMGKNKVDLYGAITAQAVSLSEINAPGRTRIFSMAVTAMDRHDCGKPTSWSATIDALSAGRTFDPTTQGLIYLDNAESNAHRLFILSAGNVLLEDLDKKHLDRSDLETVHDPSQAWNALTVGAYTEKSAVNDPLFQWSPLAPHGELSPWSTTSVLFEDWWPIKPDVVFEGGNVATDGSSFDPTRPELCLLSTSHRLTENLFTLSNATSAATAQVARLAAIISAEYPNFWPETVRALIVHSAEWTKAMGTHMNGAKTKRDREKLVRRYGFGVPNIENALRSANDSLTLIVQSNIRPFLNGKMGYMHFHSLPWPKRVLEDLGDKIVQLRVTLSYFIEPNPGRRGWNKRYQYSSHGLRFALKPPTEDPVIFRKRLNFLALNNGEKKPESSGDTGWFLGEMARSKGSIHMDIWEGTAADLADRGIIGIYPVSGWWKDQPKRDRSEFGARYSLVVSIKTSEENVDIWTPVANEIGIPVEETIIET